MVETQPPERYQVIIRSEKGDLLRLPGAYVKAAVEHLARLSKGGETATPRE
jgi:hypothetical protein